MITLAKSQSKSNMCIALFNRELHKNSICPANHDVNYQNGWFYMDDRKPFHRPELTQEAEDLIKSGVEVLFSSSFNTYLVEG